MEDRNNDGAIALLIIAALLVGGGGVAYGMSQQSQRERDQQRYREELKQVRDALQQCRNNLVETIQRLGEKNFQVLVLLSKLRELESKESTLASLAA
jgi:uncharacterized protein HemX